MINFTLTIIIALAIYNIIFTIRVNKLENEMAKYKKFIYAQYYINVETNEIHKLCGDRLKRLENEVFSLGDHDDGK